MSVEKLTVPPGFRLIFRASKKDKDGNQMNAKDYGFKAWPLLVRIGK